MKEFRAFILRGSVVDLAVGVVIGAAFGAVVTSMVQDVLTPLLGLLHMPDFSSAAVSVGNADIRYGLFLNSLISFLLIAAAVFFLIVKPVNRLMAQRRTEPGTDATARECPYCLSSVPRSASVCAYCTRELTPGQSP